MSEVKDLQTLMYVHVVLCAACPENYAGGILWPSTLENQLRFADCRDADSRFR